MARDLPAIRVLGKTCRDLGCRLGFRVQGLCSEFKRITVDSGSMNSMKLEDCTFFVQSWSAGIKALQGCTAHGFVYSAAGLLVLVQDSVCIMDSITYRGFGDLGSAKLSPCHMHKSPPSGSFNATFREKAEVPFPHQPSTCCICLGFEASGVGFIRV